MTEKATSDVCATAPSLADDLDTILPNADGNFQDSVAKLKRAAAFLRLSAVASTPSAAHRAAGLTVLALDRMIGSVYEEMSENDPGNHATLGALRGELRGLNAARTYLVEAMRRDNASVSTVASTEADLLKVAADLLSGRIGAVTAAVRIQQLAPAASSPLSASADGAALCDAIADSARYEEIKELLLNGGAVRYDSGNREWIVEDGKGNRSHCAGGLSVLLDERINADPPVTDRRSE